MMDSNYKSYSRISKKSAWIVALGALLVSAAGIAAATGMFSETGTVTAVNGDQIIVEMDDGSKAVFVPDDPDAADAMVGDKIEFEIDD